MATLDSTPVLPAPSIPDPTGTLFAAAVTCPCDGCATAAKCAKELLACQAFGHFVEPWNTTHGTDWRASPRAPSRAIYLRLFECPEDREAAAALSNIEALIAKLARGQRQAVRRHDFATVAVLGQRIDEAIATARLGAV